MAQALLPLKDLVRAKTRLAGLLAPSERRALAQAMAEDVLAVLSAHPEVGRVTLVSDDPAAHLLAARYRARCWSERELDCSGLNPVLERATSRLVREDAGPLLVLHADLPLLAASDISAALAARQNTGGLVVGCDRHGTGTNLLCFDAGAAPRFCFGAASCGAHQQAARTQGIPVMVLRRPGIALDVDEPQDLACLLGRLERDVGGHTAALLRGSGLGARMELALASLAPRGLPLDEEGVI